MDMIYDELNRVLDSAGVPRIVRERCPYCHGSGLREIGIGPLARLDTCHACVGRGYIAAEAA